MAKFFLVLTIIAAGAAAGLGYVTYTKIVEKNKLLADTKATLQTTQNQLKATKDTLKETQATLDTTKTALDAKTAEAQTLSSKVDELNGQLKTANDALADANKKLSDMAAQLEELRKTIPNSGTSGPQDLSKMIKDLQDKIAEDATIQKALQQKADEADKRAAALQKKETDRVAKLNQKGLEGVVMAVNPGYGFVVISLGDHQGAVPNAEVIVKRGEAFIAKLRITSVEPLVSIADIESDSVAKGQRVLPGDKVVFTGDTVNQ